MVENLQDRIQENIERRRINYNGTSGPKRALMLFVIAALGYGAYYTYGLFSDDKDVPYEKQAKQIVREYMPELEKGQEYFPGSVPIDSEGVKEKTKPFEKYIYNPDKDPQPTTTEQEPEQQPEQEDNGRLYMNESTGELIRINDRGIILSYDKPAAVNELVEGAYVYENTLYNEWNDLGKGEESGNYYFQNPTTGTIISINKYFRIQSVEQPKQSDELEPGVYIHENTLMNEWNHVEE